MRAWLTSGVRGLFIIFVAIGGLVWACADTTTFSDPDGAVKVDGKASTDLKDLESIRIEPADAVLEILNDKPAVQAYQAFGTFKDGSTREITADVAFSVRDTWVGLFKGAEFTSATTGGGATEVFAETSTGVSGATTLTVIYKRVVIEKDFPQAKVGAFKDDAEINPGRGPALVYPPDNVLLPPNLTELELQWYPGSGNDLFELRIKNGGTDIRIYTKCKTVGAGCGYTPTPETWQIIVTAFKGKDPAEIVVRGTDEASAKSFGVAPSRFMSIAQEDILGGLYYWNATPGTVVRYDFGKPKPKGTLFVSAPQVGALFCVGCHALSRNGKRLAVGLDMPAPAPLRILDVPTRNTISSGAANFMAFSPDGDRIITSDGNSLVLQDATTLTPLAPNPLRAKGTMPDWSPDASKVVYADPATILPLPFGTPGIEKGSIRLMAHDAVNDKWLGPKTLVESKGENNYYPTFSPDNAFVAFNRASGSSYDAPDAAVWLVRADGTKPEVELKLANDAEGIAGQYGNSWPKFAPFVQKYKGRKLMWLTFSSRRDYGLRLKGKSQAQLWMVAIDPGKAEINTDPSYPAFWLPFQDINTGNHIAQWTETVVRNPCDPQGNCPTGEFCEDGYCEPGIQ